MHLKKWVDLLHRKSQWVPPLPLLDGSLSVSDRPLIDRVRKTPLDSLLQDEGDTVKHVRKQGPSGSADLAEVRPQGFPTDQHGSGTTDGDRITGFLQESSLISGVPFLDQALITNRYHKSEQHE